MRCVDIDATKASVWGFVSSRHPAAVEDRRRTWRAPRIVAVQVGLRVAFSVGVVRAKLRIANRRVHPTVASISGVRVSALTVAFLASNGAAVAEPQAALADVAMSICPVSAVATPPVRPQRYAPARVLAVW